MTIDYQKFLQNSYARSPSQILEKRRSELQELIETHAKQLAEAEVRIAEIRDKQEILRQSLLEIEAALVALGSSVVTGLNARRARGSNINMRNK